ncbi:sensor histidine kinase [Allosphingosinicella sp.]|uniref:sensor histidine kinase n=1 Tax=Allosphingosinicella sp. TaxID=2823234 RepID=UPI003D753EED
MGAVLVAGAAVGLRLAIDDYVTGIQFITFFPAAILVAFMWGTRPGLLTALLCGIAGWYLFLEPLRSFRIQRSREIISLLTYFGISGFMAIATGGLVAARERERQTAKTLKESEERFRAVVEQMPIGVIIAKVSDGEIVTYNRAAEDLMGHPVLGARIEEYGSYGAIHAEGAPYNPEDYPTARALRGETVCAEEISYRRGDGTLTFLSVAATPVMGSDGSTELAVCTFTDVSERKRQEEHQRLLIHELNHRVKNTLAIIQALAQQTFKQDADVAQARSAFEGRLAALSSAHDVLTEQRWEAASLDEIVEHAVRPVSVSNDRVEIAGPRVLLPPKTAVSLTMAIHELATNALKYGSLSTAKGRVSVRWNVDRDVLRIEWRERGGPQVKPPTNRGFGTRLLESGLASELRGTVRMSFEPAGLVCTLEACIPEVTE